MGTKQPVRKTSVFNFTSVKYGSHQCHVTDHTTRKNIYGAKRGMSQLLKNKCFPVLVRSGHLSRKLQFNSIYFVDSEKSSIQNRSPSLLFFTICFIAPLRYRFDTVYVHSKFGRFSRLYYCGNDARITAGFLLWVGLIAAKAWWLCVCVSVLYRSWYWTRRRRRWILRLRHEYTTQYERHSATVHSSSLHIQCTLYCSVTASSSSTKDRSLCHSLAHCSFCL